jgi:hypothetical protein
MVGDTDLRRKEYRPVIFTELVKHLFGRSSRIDERPQKHVIQLAGRSQPGRQIIVRPRLRKLTEMLTDEPPYRDALQAQI